MNKKTFIASLFIFLSLGINGFCAKIDLGKKLPDISVETKGKLTPEYTVNENKMVFKKDSEIEYQKWNTSMLRGKIVTVYHLAARNGIDDINKPFIDALIKAKLPEKLPESEYKTATILNTDDALWGTSKIASKRFEKSQKKFPYAYYINDDKGVAQKTWGLKKKDSAVIILDKKGNVLFFKEGKLNPDEIDKAVLLIQKELADK